MTVTEPRIRKKHRQTFYYHTSGLVQARTYTPYDFEKCSLTFLKWIESISAIKRMTEIIWDSKSTLCCFSLECRPSTVTVNKNGYILLLITSWLWPLSIKHLNHGLHREKKNLGLHRVSKFKLHTVDSCSKSTCASKRSVHLSDALLLRMS